MSKITVFQHNVYKTTDGLEFLIYDEAFKHQSKLDLEMELSKIWYSSIDSDEIINWLIEKKDTIIEILSTTKE